MGPLAASLATILGLCLFSLFFFFFLPPQQPALVGVGQPGYLGGRGPSWGSWGQQQKKGCQADERR